MMNEYIIATMLAATPVTAPELPTFDEAQREWATMECTIKTHSRFVFDTENPSDEGFIWSQLETSRSAARDIVRAFKRNGPSGIENHVSHRVANGSMTVAEAQSFYSALLACHDN